MKARNILKATVIAASLAGATFANGVQAEPVTSTDVTSVAAKQAPTTPVLEMGARQALAAYLELWKSKADSMASAFNEDAVLEYSLYIPEINSEIRGRESIINSVQAVAQLGRDWSFNNIRLFPTLNPNTYFAQYTASATLVATGEYFERNVIVVLELDGERASRLREFFNPAIALASTSAQALSKAREKSSKQVHIELAK